MCNRRLQGHLCALFCAFVWGWTFVSSKLLLEFLSPVQLLFSRTLIGYAVLWILAPHPFVPREKKDLLRAALAGLFGIFLYYFFENTALKYGYASNVGVLTATAPLFTVLVCSFAHREKVRGSYLLGFCVSMAGIVLVSFNGEVILRLSPKGDAFALAAAVTWGFYSLFTGELEAKDYPNIPLTRAIIFFGLACMLVANLFDPTPWRLGEVVKGKYLFHLLFLGIAASGICFVAWNESIRLIGPYVSSFYIYAIPAVTIAASALVLGERITALHILGAVLAVGGLGISVGKRRKKPEG